MAVLERKKEMEVGIDRVLGGLTRQKEEKPELQKVIERSTFKLKHGKFVYVKVRKAPEHGRHFMISSDNSEITVVTLEENLRYLDMEERRGEEYNIIELNSTVPFYTVGLIATVSGAIAKFGISLLVISTYSKEYILVNERYSNAARNALTTIGLKEIK